MGNLYLELTERAQDFIADYADNKYPSLDDAREAFTKEKGEEHGALLILKLK